MTLTVLSQLKDAENLDIILLDLRLPSGSGLDLLEKLKIKKQASKTIIISGEGTVQDAFKATQLGAFDFIEKAFFAPEKIIVSISRCLDFNKIHLVNKKLRKLAKGHEILEVPQHKIGIRESKSCANEW